MVSLFYLRFLLLGVLLLSQTPLSSAADPVRTFISEDSHGKIVRLRDDRRPALYTKNFGDCQGDSLLNITRFDAGFYKDNMTVAFHFEGNNAVQRDSVMLYIGVFAYGERRFELMFDPCPSHIRSLCPMTSAIPIQASGVIPVGPKEVSEIPDIAFSIPDFEGQAILRVFSNTTRSQIGCYSAVVTNGATFSHPVAVGSVLGAFTVVAGLSSIGVAIYGTTASSSRKHYAHSLSVLVVFSTLQHIYFTGALSMNWPSVLAAFWSNYAWSAGMIYNERMQNSINQFIGNNRGNISMVSGAKAGSASEIIGGGYDVSRIYQRELSPQILSPGMLKQWRIQNRAEGLLQARADTNASMSFPWYGSHVKPGLPLPGNYSGFAGTLSIGSIPVSNAFMTAFIWLLTLLAIIVAGMVVLKWSIECLSFIRIVKTDRLAHFRNNWIRYTWMAVERILFVMFFMMLFLTLFQFTLGGAAGVTAIAAVVFVFFLAGLFGIAGYALYYRLSAGHFVAEPDRLILQPRKVLKVIPWLGFQSEGRGEANNTTRAAFTFALPWRRIRHIYPTSGPPSVHDDEDYLRKFAWLSGRFRRTRWWFFGVWLVYEFIRACLYGGASGHPFSQIIGLLVVELIALIVIAWMRPFEATRLNALMVYFLGFSKVSTVALSSAFDPRFNVERITATIIGVVIIVIQSILTILLLIAILVGAASSYISITRHHSDAAFKPRSWVPLRGKYLAHVDQRALDLPPVPESPTTSNVELVEPTFTVSSVRRYPKIEDEIMYPETNNRSHNASNTSITSREQTALAARAAARSRALSAQSNPSSNSLPYGVRPVRPSWGSREFMDCAERQRTNAGTSISAFSNSSTPPPIPQVYTVGNANSRETVAQNSRGTPVSSTASSSGAHSATVPAPMALYGLNEDKGSTKKYMLGDTDVSTDATKSWDENTVPAKAEDKQPKRNRNGRF